MIKVKLNTVKNTDNEILLILCDCTFMFVIVFILNFLRKYNKKGGKLFTTFNNYFFSTAFAGCLLLGAGCWVGAASLRAQRSNLLPYARARSVSCVSPASTPYLLSRKKGLLRVLLHQIRSEVLYYMLQGLQLW